MSFYRIYRVAYRNRPQFQLPVRLASSRGRSRSVVSRVLIYGTIGAAVTGGGAITYANYDPDFKQTVDTYVPRFARFAELNADIWNQGAELIKQGWNTIKPVILPEKGNTGIQVPDTKRPTEDNNGDSTTSSGEQSITDQVTVDKVIDKIKERVEEEEVEKIDKVGEKLVKEVESTDTKEISNKVEESNESKLESSEQLLTLPEEGSGTPPMEPPKGDVKELEGAQETILDPVSIPDPVIEAKNTSVENELRSVYQDFILLSDRVISSLQHLVQAMEAHHSKIQQSITSPPPDNEADIDSIAESIGTSKKEVDEALKRVNECQASQCAVSKRLSEAYAEATSLGICEELSEQIREKALEYEKSFEASDQDVKWTEARHRSWQEEYQKKLKEERDSAPQLPLADLDTQQEALLIMLRKKIENMEEEENKRIAEALSKQEEEFQKKLDSTLQDQKAGFDEQLRKKEDEINEFYEDKLKVQLYQQADAYSSHLEESLKAQAKELSAQIGKDYSRRLAEKDVVYQQQLAAAMAQLRGIRSMINTVSEAGESTRRQQTIRTASDSLTGAIINANADLDPYSKRSISKEVSSLMEAASGDEFIQTVLSAIPKQVLEEGITSENGLVRRFGRVRKICKRVSLIGEEGGGLGAYLLSFIQSLLMFDMIFDKMAVSEQRDPADMNTFKLLSCASMHLDKGDLETAVRLVNQLSGESRQVAQDWIKEACLYLETKQAVLVISEYLAASCFTTVQ